MAQSLPAKREDPALWDPALWEASGNPQPVLLIIHRAERYFCLSDLMTDSDSGSPEGAWNLSLPPAMWLQRKDPPFSQILACYPQGNSFLGHGTKEEERAGPPCPQLAPCETPVRHCPAAFGIEAQAGGWVDDFSFPSQLWKMGVCSQGWQEE